VHQHNLTSRNRIAGLAASALLFAACSNAGTGATTTPTTGATQAPPSTAATAGPTAGPTAGASQGAEAYEVELGNSAKYGKFLTGEGGKTLYLFTPDTTSASNCNGDCAATWPPFTLEGEETVKGGAGVTGTFATIARQDGSMQVTYAGHPLYYYGADTAAGDTNGEGLFNKWYLIDASGSAVMGAKASGGGKY
jgi:predicted lipoprotein with Yx(FWY)xxD motif